MDYLLSGVLKVTTACIYMLASIIIIQESRGVAVAMQPRDPIQCGSSGCNVSNCYGTWPDRTQCTAAEVVYPTTEEEIVWAVADAVQKKQKLKVVSRWAHSMPKLICPGGKDGLVISMRDYNRNLVIDKENMTVTADSGVELWQLIESVAAAGLALPYTPYWEGVSIGGLLSTGSHGSSFFQKGGAVHEYVTSMTLVIPATREQGYARAIELTEADAEELNAAKVSLGVLGVISKVRLQLEPMFKRSVTNEVLADADLEERILPFASAHEFGDVTWHPAMRNAVYKLDDRVSVHVSGDGVNDFIGFRPTDVGVLETARALETFFESTNNANGKCVSGSGQVSTLLALANGLKNDDNTFTGYPVIGYQNRLQGSSACLLTSTDDPRVCCPWDSRVNGEFFQETALSIPVTKLHAFIQDVKALRDLDPMGLCGVDLYYGFFMRFVKASSAFLGEQEDAVKLDITYYRSREAGSPRLLEDVLEEVEQMAAFKYGGRPHWGKNRPVAFLGVRDKFPNLHRFLRVKQRFDPDGLFSSEWSDAVLGLAPLQVSLTDGCALEGLCICSVDAHCAPHLGYLCQPGKIYREARVCRNV